MCVERNFREFEFRFSHLDGDVAVVFHFQFDNACPGFDADRIAVRQFEVGDESRKGACAVSALFDFATVGVENAVTEIDIRVVRFLDDQNLVGTDTEPPVGDKSELFGRKLDGLAVSVQYDEVVACTMHFREFQFHQQCPADCKVVIQVKKESIPANASVVASFAINGSSTCQSSG